MEHALDLLLEVRFPLELLALLEDLAGFVEFLMLSETVLVLPSEIVVLHRKLLEFDALEFESLLKGLQLGD